MNIKNINTCIKIKQRYKNKHNNNDWKNKQITDVNRIKIN